MRESECIHNGYSAMQCDVWARLRRNPEARGSGVGEKRKELRHNCQGLLPKSEGADVPEMVSTSTVASSSLKSETGELRSRNAENETTYNIVREMPAPLYPNR